jgi:cytochrome c peroxidase
MARNRALYPALSAVLLLVGCSGGGGSNTAANPPLSAMAALGNKIFHDPNLSAAGNQACSTCHVKAAGLANANGAAVMFGGPALDKPGLRNTPSLTYTGFTPQFSLTGDGPSGGFFRDGRAKTLADQAQAPFTNEFEMAWSASGRKALWRPSR